MFQDSLFCGLELGWKWRCSEKTLSLCPDWVWGPYTSCRISGAKLLCRDVYVHCGDPAVNSPLLIPPVCLLPSFPFLLQTWVPESHIGDWDVALPGNPVRKWWWADEIGRQDPFPEERGVALALWCRGSTYAYELCWKNTVSVCSYVYMCTRMCADK